MIRSRRFYRILYHFQPMTMSTADLEFRLLKNQSHFPRKTIKGSFNFLQERSVCLASTFGSQVNYFMLFSHHADQKCFFFLTKTMCIVLEPKKIKILQEEKTPVDSIVVYIVLLTWKASNEEVAATLKHNKFHWAPGLKPRVMNVQVTFIVV